MAKVKSLGPTYRPTEKTLSKRSKPKQYYDRALDALRESVTGFDAQDGIIKGRYTAKVKAKITRAHKRLINDFGNVDRAQNDLDETFPAKAPQLVQVPRKRGESLKDYRGRIHKIQKANGQQPSYLKGVMLDDIAGIDSFRYDKKGRLIKKRKIPKNPEYMEKIELFDRDIFNGGDDLMEHAIEVTMDAWDKGEESLNDLGFDIVYAQYITRKGKGILESYDDPEQLARSLIEIIMEYSLVRKQQISFDVVGILVTGERL